FLTGLLLLRAALSRPSPARPQAPDRAGPASRSGIVFIVDGIGGLDVLHFSAQVTLPLAGVRHEIRDFAWTHGKGHYLKDLQDTRYVLRKAEVLAAQVRQAKAREPGRPIYLVAG